MNAMSGSSKFLNIKTNERASIDSRKDIPVNFGAPISMISKAMRHDNQHYRIAFVDNASICLVSDEVLAKKTIYSAASAFPNALANAPVLLIGRLIREKSLRGPSFESYCPRIEH
jgi:hypothetical protein